MESKEQIVAACQELIDQKISAAETSLVEIQHQSNEETKSSAGDKYETTRAMLQLEKDKVASQLAEWSKIRRAFSTMTLDKPSDAIDTGSLVKTNKGSLMSG